MLPTPSDPDEPTEPAPKDDSGVVGAILAGQRARLRRMVASRLDHRLASRVDPSDVVQEALAEAASQLPDYLNNPPLPLLPWLRQFVWDRIIKLHRHHILAKKRSVTREETGVRWPAGGPIADETSPSGHMIRDESRRRLRDGMARLSEADRDLLTKRHIEALSMAEIAESLGIKEGAVKVRHLRALRRLQSLMEGPP